MRCSLLSTTLRNPMLASRVASRFFFLFSLLAHRRVPKLHGVMISDKNGAVVAKAIDDVLLKAMQVASCHGNDACVCDLERAGMTSIVLIRTHPSFYVPQRRPGSQPDITVDAMAATFAVASEQVRSLLVKNVSANCVLRTHFASFLPLAGEQAVGGQQQLHLEHLRQHGRAARQHFAARRHSGAHRQGREGAREGEKRRGNESESSFEDAHPPYRFRVCRVLGSSVPCRSAALTATAGWCRPPCPSSNTASSPCGRYRCTTSNGLFIWYPPSGYAHNFFYLHPSLHTHARTQAVVEDLSMENEAEGAGDAGVDG